MNYPFCRHGLFAGLIALAGCAEGEIGGAAVPVGPASDEVEVESVLAGSGEVLTPAEATLRQRRRMDLDQLDRSIRRATGGVGWVERRGANEVNLFEELGPTLGRPDFLESTSEDLTPSAMFQKFLDDAARSVCADLFEAEENRAEAERTFFVYAEPAQSLTEAPEAVRRNLSQLLLRFHGHGASPDLSEQQPWLELMSSLDRAGVPPAGVWRTVCVGLITHPDFYLY